MDDLVIGLDHVGISVRDLARSVEFYGRMFDLTPEITFVASGEAMERGVGIAGADASIAVLHLGNSRVELLEYRQPRGREFEGRNNDVGSPHIAIEVADIDRAYHELLARGAVFNSPPSMIEDGPLRGCWWCYFPDPDGVSLEIFQR